MMSKFIIINYLVIIKILKEIIIRILNFDEIVKIKITKSKIIIISDRKVKSINFLILILIK
jgi:hypothetical protein